jgi:hypothetical protein
MRQQVPQLLPIQTQGVQEARKRRAESPEAGFHAVLQVNDIKNPDEEDEEGHGEQQASARAQNPSEKAFEHDGTSV